MTHRSPILLLLALALGQPASVEAQATHLGARGGISVTDYSFPSLSEDWRSGVVAGAFLAVPVRPHVSLQPELSWVRKGATWFREGIGPTRGELDYVSAAMLARLSVPIAGPLSVSALGGPWLGILATCGTDDSRDALGDCESIFGADEHRSIDAGWDLGLGAAFQTGPLLVQLDVRRSRGLFGLLKDRPDDNPTTKSTQMTLAFGYRVSPG